MTPPDGTSNGSLELERRALERRRYPERDVCLRICVAYGGDPADTDWHSVDGVARILHEMTSLNLGHARDAAIANLQAAFPDAETCDRGAINPAPAGSHCQSCAAEDRS